MMSEEEEGTVSEMGDEKTSSEVEVGVASKSLSEMAEGKTNDSASDEGYVEDGDNVLGLDWRSVRGEEKRSRGRDGERRRYGRVKKRRRVKERNILTLKLGWLGGWWWCALALAVTLTG
ncbi:unnamed protein product [Ilex paraguariensis]|uniref:Uncharacterized protein n=1 Tax=Ilex paraguariensis TaxID=185542 RepID=A0ABC8QXM0_9AQUA